jgi:hypothetical protein
MLPSPIITWWRDDVHLFVSYSDDFGATFQASKTNFCAAISPRVPRMLFHEDGARTFVEAGDTLMFTTTITPTEPYSTEHPPDPDDASDFYGGAPCDKQNFSDVIIRSVDGGATWMVGDLTQISPGLNPHESNLAVDPNDSDHILAFARCQRGLRPEEAPGAYRRFGNPDGAGLKNGALFESFDRGRMFALHGTSQYYGHRGFVMFAPTGEVVVLLPD